MQEPKQPHDEPKRIDSLRKLDVLDTPAEERFDRITRIAKRVFHVPVALVSLVDSDRQWFKSVQGLPINETPRVVSLCAHAILGDAALVVPDATKDERFHENPLVVGDPHVRFYAGQVLRGPDGAKVGTLCILDRKPREFSEDDVHVLRDLASMAQSELRVVALSEHERALLKDRDRLQRQSLIDPVTRVWSRAAIEEILPKERARAQREGAPLSVAIATIEPPKSALDDHHKGDGDIVMREVAQRIRSAVRVYDLVGRRDAEEFLILLPNCSEDEAAEVVDRARARVEAGTIQAKAVNVAVATLVGIASGKPMTGNEDFVGAAVQAVRRARDTRRVERVAVF